MDKQRGQSLLEILVGLGIIIILMGASTYALVAALKTSTITDQTQTAGLVGNSLMDSAITLAEGNWNNVYNLAKGSSNHYYIANSPTTTPYIIAGDESVLSDNITNGLVGHWKFDELSGTTAYDSSGQGNFGSLVGSPTRTASTTCKIGACLSFDGIDKYINIPNNDSLDFGNSDFSISLWIKTPATTDAEGIIYKGAGSFNTGGLGWDMRVRTSGPKIEFCIWNGVGTCPRLAINSIPVNTWFHVVVTHMRSTGETKSYLNGVLNSTATLTTGSYTDSYVLYIGYGENGYSVSSLDDVRIYNRVFSASEISQLYNSSVYSRYFYVDNVNRTACGAGSITTSAVTTCTGSANDVQEDPSTQKITVGTYWNAKGASQSFENSEYVTRWINSYAQQNSWGGFAGVAGAVTNFDSNYYDYSNIATTTTGSIKISGF